MINSKKYKSRMQSSLPFVVDEFIVREQEREDIDLYVNWPDYPAPYEMFNTSLKSKPISERERRWQADCANHNSITLVVDHKEAKMIAQFFIAIDWKEKYVRNMGIRLHPDWCNRGNGTRLLEGITNWCFDNGLERIQFDVLKTNQRAVKSYKNAGYNVIGEFERGSAVFYLMESKRL